jgi:von Willebrand factor type A domain/Aerotolerance regulator N-terminal
MFFLNLTPAEFLALFGSLGGLVTALYLLDRAKRRKIVSTLQFWVQAGAAEQSQARRKMQQPCSLVLQLASLLLLLLAISRMQWGSRQSRGHDHVLLVDTGSWTGAPVNKDASHTTVLDEEKQKARDYLSVLPRNDRVMLVAVDNLASPVVRFTSNSRQLISALDALSPGFSAIDIDSALSFARQAQGWSGGASGEIAYIGPQLAALNPVAEQPSNLRVIPITADRENCGIVQMNVQQLENEADSWKALVRIRNYGARVRNLRLEMHYGGTAFAPRNIKVPAGEEITAQYAFVTQAPGELVAKISPGGSLSSDDQASIFLPRVKSLRVAVFTDRPAVLKPLLEADRQLAAQVFSTSQYQSKPAAEIVILDNFSPLQAPEVPALWIDPPGDHLPIPVKGMATDSLMRWGTGSPFESAMHAKPLRLTKARTFELFEGDEAVASVPDGPVIVLRSATTSHGRMAVVGFDPAEGELRYEVGTPLLFASLVQWLDPSAFRSLTVSAEEVGLVNLNLEGAEQRDQLQVADDRGQAVAYSRRQNTLQLFTEHPATFTVTSKNRQRVISLRLPSVATQLWKPAPDTLIGLPSTAIFTRTAVDLWKWLALAGGAMLLAEWLLFGRFGRLKRVRLAPWNIVHRSSTRDASRELVQK